MRDTNLLRDSFTFEVNRILSEYFSGKSGRSTVSNISKCMKNNRFQNEVYLNSWSIRDRELAALISWWLPEEIGILLRLSLQEEIEKCYFDRERFLVEQMFLKSKELSILFLLETRKWHSRDFFGNVISESSLNRICLLIKPRMLSIKQRQRRVLRHRGYRDKGTLRLPHRKIHDKISLNREEREDLEERQAISDALSFIEGWIT